MNKKLTPEIIKELKEKHGDIYKTTIDGVDYVWRPLRRDEYKEIVNQDMDIIDKEEIIARKCTVWPELTEEDWLNIPAGVPTTISDGVMSKSGFETATVEKL